jgi:histone deacetylase 11
MRRLTCGPGVTIVYSHRYNIGFFGIERWHPFDSKKYGRAWAELQKTFKSDLLLHSLLVDRPASQKELLLGHTPEYLTGILQPRRLADALELPPLAHLPGWLLRWRVVNPMRWAVRGTMLAAKSALEQCWSVNLGGGYHHAKPDRGEGFCLYSDIAIAVRWLRQEGLLPAAARIVYVDLDAHQGNGVCHQFMSDRQVFLFDMYNREIYPFRDAEARCRIDCDLPLHSGCSGSDYLRVLRKDLPVFLGSVGRSASIGVGIYNAGTDVFAGDALGGLGLTLEEIVERDALVLQEFRNRGIPVVMLLSGGYSKVSYRIVAASVENLMRKMGLRDSPPS